MLTTARLYGTAQTIGAVTGDVVTVPLMMNSINIVLAMVGGSDLTDNCGFVVIAAFVRGGGGSAALGAVTTVFAVNSGGFAGVALTVVNSSPNCIVRATGIAGKTITWQGLAQVQQFTP